MKFLILGGFLGSGKTSALMKLAHFIVDTSNTDKENKLVILENEVGEVGIDDSFLRGGGYQVDNLFAGCACCTVSGELISAVDKIQENFDPEWIILETTGIAYPAKIKESLEQVKHITPIVTILVDASRWKRLRIPMHGLLTGQIEGANSVIINKIDLVDESTLNEVISDIKKIDATPDVFPINATGEVKDSVWERIIQQ